MKKSIIFTVVAISLAALCFTLVPKVTSQLGAINILSYSHYTSTQTGDFIVVGEVQNTGSNTIDLIGITGTLYSPDNSSQAQAYTQAYGTQILPQEKVPFYMDFQPLSSSTGDLSWMAQGIGSINLRVVSAIPTDSRQYTGLVIKSNSSSVDNSGYYMITGAVQNTGTLASNQTWVVATFYNASGTVVATGHSSVLTPTSIPAGGTAPFTLYPDDVSTTTGSQVASYVLLVQTTNTPPTTTTPTPVTTTPPPATPTPSPSATPTPTPTQTQQVGSVPITYFYAIVAVVIIVVILAAALVLRKRR